jgi:resuscitation-promoting factor RpfB
VPGSAEVWSPVRHRPAVLAAYAAVLAVIAGGTLAYMASQRTVALTVDGENRSVETFARTVSGVLNDAKVPVSDRDLVSPNRTATVADGSQVVVRYGRKLTLSIDGKPREVWVHGRTVAEALQELPERLTGAWVSASRSQPIGRQGLSFDIRLAHRVTFVVNGARRVPVTTTAPTIAAAIAGAGIALPPGSKTSPAVTAAPVDGQIIYVVTKESKRVVSRVTVPFSTVRKADPDTASGTDKVTTAGKNGVKEVVYADTYVAGKRTARVLLSQRVITAAVSKVITYGTKGKPSSTASAPAVSADGLNWAALANCESGGNPQAVNAAGYYGLYQFGLGTWAAVGGSGNPIDASASEQTSRAQILYADRGASPWPVCGKLLFS